MKTAHRNEVRDQIRTDLRDSGLTAAAAVTEVPRHHVVLATPHQATVVHVREIAEVKDMGRTSLGLSCRVTLRNGDRHFVPDARAVVLAMRAAGGGR
jgi:hypothetical protein